MHKGLVQNSFLVKTTTMYRGPIKFTLFYNFLVQINAVLKTELTTPKKLIICPYAFPLVWHFLWISIYDRYCKWVKRRVLCRHYFFHVEYSQFMYWYWKVELFWLDAIILNYQYSCKHRIATLESLELSPWMLSV